ncbi:methyltransferase domain-containing protein [Myxococcus xanthus]|uniref:methyltransferase domain-containing protein n=1 Tax=Myxococcus xanthus TaxID=34 RepID=UPI001128DB63|nr:methyltransferase domain-containing protein [Myxococcus xanthus]
MRCRTSPRPTCRCGLEWARRSSGRGAAPEPDGWQIAATLRAHCAASILEGGFHRYDGTGSVDYRVADAYVLPFDDGCFDVVTCMDFLEHVEEPARVVAEAARVLAPGGLFFFHTFNRNWLAGLIIIQAVEWFVPNTPDHLHVLRLFITPEELQGHCEAAGLRTREQVGGGPTGAPVRSSNPCSSGGWPPTSASSSRRRCTCPTWASP